MKNSQKRTPFWPVALATLALMAGCATQKAGDPASQAPFSMTAPLSVPDISTFAATPARPLAGQYHQVNWSSLPGWNQDDARHLWLTFYNNCRGLMRPVSGSKTMPARATPAVWQPVCQAAAQSGIDPHSDDAATVKAFLEQHLQPWQVTENGKSSNTVTGYYEPVVHGSRSQGGRYQWPMYAVPDDLLTIDLGQQYPELAGKRIRGKLSGNSVVPYDTRSQIGQRDSKPPVIVWLDDPVEAFFLQVQGSGRVRLDDGSTIRLAYANHNGRPYSSIGKWLADKGELPLAQANMQNIKAWAKANPDRIDEMLNTNQAMVFFREEALPDEAAGPKGAYGIPLVAERSVAVDPAYVPLGSPLFLATTRPHSKQPMQRVVFAQDTGAAIKGVARTDFFWGSGDAAGELAGRMKQPGQIWILWPRAAGAPEAR
ncbi:MAG: murein transglycosylase A [Advenella sp.]